MKEVERVCLGDVRVQEQVRRLGLPEGAEVVVEPWAYATDGVEDMAGRVTMVCVTLPEFSALLLVWVFKGRGEMVVVRLRYGVLC